MAVAGGGREGERERSVSRIDEGRYDWGGKGERERCLREISSVVDSGVGLGCADGVISHCGRGSG